MSLSSKVCMDKLSCVTQSRNFFKSRLYEAMVESALPFSTRNHSKKSNIAEFSVPELSSIEILKG